MTIEQLINENGLDFFFKLFGWQGGTVHQVRYEIKKRLAQHGVAELKDTKELVTLAIFNQKGLDIENYMVINHPDTI